jgi:hypothetical protein
LKGEKIAMSNESILRRIKKALALAENNTSAEEAQTALLMAQSLMAKHSIEMSDVIEEEKQLKVVVHEGITDYGRTPFWKKSLAQVIGDNFRCMAYTSSGRGKSKLIFLGLKEDTSLAKEMFEFAVNSLTYSVNRYMRERRKIEDSVERGVRNDYILGFIAGLRDKFKEQVNKNNWGLVLVKDTLVVQEIDRMGFSVSSGSKIQRGHSSEARQSGYKAGKSLSRNNQLQGGQ